MERESSSFRYLLVLYIILIAMTAAVVFFTYPVMKRNIDESGIYENYLVWKKERKEKSEKYVVTLYSDDKYVSVERSVDKTTDDLHSLVEALILPLDESEKEEGYTTYIPEGTTLIGISSEDGYFYAEFSSALLTSRDITKAAEQIKKTLESYYTLESLTIICGSKIIRI